MDNYKREVEESYLLNSIETSSINLRKAYFSLLVPYSLRALIFALICLTLGSRMLPLQYFFKMNVIFLSLIIFLFCVFCTLFNLKILLELTNKNKIYVYNEIVSI